MCSTILITFFFWKMQSFVIFFCFFFVFFLKEVCAHPSERHIHQKGFFCRYAFFFFSFQNSHLLGSLIFPFFPLSPSGFFFFLCMVIVLCLVCCQLVSDEGFFLHIQQ